LLRVTFADMCDAMLLLTNTTFSTRTRLPKNNSHAANTNAAKGVQVVKRKKPVKPKWTAEDVSGRRPR
jgi:hypothetical protein